VQLRVKVRYQVQLGNVGGGMEGGRMGVEVSHSRSSRSSMMVLESGFRFGLSPQIARERPAKSGSGAAKFSVNVGTNFATDFFRRVI